MRTCVCGNIITSTRVATKYCSKTCTDAGNRTVKARGPGRPPNGERTPEFKAQFAKYQRGRRYGLSLEEIDELMIRHPVCAICGGEAQAIDHCHETKKVRAMLCHSCNRGLGCFKDSIDLLESALDYLADHK